MNYDYKLVNVDPNGAFIKRFFLYLALLSVTVAVALVILVILFERYLLLLLPGGMLLFSFTVWILIGRSASFYEYHFSGERLTIEGNGRTMATFSLCDPQFGQTAAECDFFKNNIVKYAFLHTRFVMKNNADERATLRFKVFEVVGVRYLLAFDDYATSLIGGRKDEI